VKDHQHHTEDVIVRMVGVIAAWLGSITLGDVQTVVGIVSGLAVLTYTVVNTYVLWRDKIKARQ